MMRKTIAIFLGAIMIMAPLISYGSDDATTIKTEVIYDPSELKLSTPLAEALPGVYWYLTFNYTFGPMFEVSLNAERFDATKLYSIHDRWYIDICNGTSSGLDNTNYLFSAKPNGPHTNNLNYWCWSACV